MIHGKTKIELYNPNTKVKEIVRSENTFQGQNIASYMKTQGIAGYQSILSDSNSGAPKSRPLWQTYVGGIFLFRDSIPANSKFMPSSNLMVGNGSYGVVNADDVPEMGSYNMSESSASVDDGITMVYDFNTAQANGTIGSICLTSETGGYIGYGNASGKNKSSKYYLTRYGNANGYNPITAVNNINACAFNNIYYQFSHNYSTHILTINKTRIPITSGHIFDSMLKTVTIDVSSLHMGNYTSFRPCVYNGKIYLCTVNGANYQANATVYYWEYNPADDTLTEKSIVNTTGVTIVVGRIYVSQGYVILQYNVGNYSPYAWMAAIYDMSTGELYDTVQVGTTTSTSNSSTIGDFGNGMILFDNYGGSLYLYDIASKSLRITNANIYTSNYPYGGPYYDGNMDNLVWWNAYSVYTFNHPLYLATINNLQSPITKDNSHTMKITYTLTEV